MRRDESHGPRHSARAPNGFDPLSGKDKHGIRYASARNEDKLFQQFTVLKGLTARNPVRGIVCQLRLENPRESVVIRAKVRINDDCVVIPSIKVKTVINIDGADQATVPKIRRQQSFSRQRRSPHTAEANLQQKQSMDETAYATSKGGAQPVVRV